MIEIEIEVSGVKEGFLWFKKLRFGISYGNNPRITDYYYSLGDLASALIKMEVNEVDIWKMINGLERKFYKIK